jgi:uncharacterized protein YydD (DUF2326 family)
MIHRIYCSLTSFKTLNFHSGLNVLLAHKSKDATSKQTRNRAGKSSVIEIVHFLLGGNVDEKTPFEANELNDVTFGMIFDLAGEKINIERINRKRAGFKLNSAIISSKEWKDFLGEKMFSLIDEQRIGFQNPSFRSLFAYFVRRQSNLAFTSPEKQSAMQMTGDYQTALLYLLGLDWEIASDWQAVREKEKNLDVLKKAAISGTLGSIIESSAELRTKLTVASDHLESLITQLGKFRVHPQYRELEEEANKITYTLNELINENTIDLYYISDLENTLLTETPPKIIDLESIYKEAGIFLPELVKHRYSDVYQFHESVIRNRKDYLSDEFNAAKLRIEERNQKKSKMDERRSKILDILKTSGALDQFTKLQGELGRLESEVETLRSRFDAAEKLEGTKSELEIERNHLLLRLRRDFTEQKDRLSEAILAYERTSKRLYEDAGSMLVKETSNGPKFEFHIHGSRSKGIKNMQIFCFDMMLMRICAKRGIGPKFLIHDSHLFDGVDGRQVISALKVGAETADELGFQYIVTMNEDDAFKEKVEDFDINEYVLKTKLTDATEDGGLFGIRFD